MSSSMIALALESRDRFLNDPLFHARVVLAQRVLHDLRAQDGLTGDLLYAALAVIAANEKGLPTSAADGWECGMADATLLALGVKPHVRNPYLKEDS